MITDEEGHEWARSKGMVRLDEYNKLASEFSLLKESYDQLLIDVKFSYETLGNIINANR